MADSTTTAPEVNSFADPAIAQRARDAINRMMLKEVDQERPDYQYGVVVSIDPAGLKCSVLITGDATPVDVAFGANRPTAAGQRVRVEGRRGDRFIADVIGGAVAADPPAASFGAPANFDMLPAAVGIYAHWDRVDGAAKYELQLATNAGMSTGIRSYITVSNEFIETNGAAPGSTVYGRARALTSYGSAGAWTAVDSTTVGYITGGTPSDGVAPASSPTAVVTGSLGFILVEWLAVSNNDPVTYDVHMSATNGFAVSGATKVGETSGTFFTVRQDAANAALVYGTTYYFKLVARDKDGSAASGGQGTGALVKIGGTDVSQIPLGQIGDGSAPSSSPTPTVTNGIGYLYLSWTKLATLDYTVYDVHISTISGFTPSPATLVGGTTDNFWFVRNQGSGASNAVLAYGTVYYVKLVARDVDGSAAASVQASGTPLRAGANDVTSGLGDNVIINSSFEETGSGAAPGWLSNIFSTSVVMGVSTAQAKEGTNSFAITCLSTDGDGAASRGFPVTPGQVYLLEGWVLASVVTTSGAYFRLEYAQDEAFTVGYDVTSGAVLNGAASTTSWVKASGQLIVPAGKTWARVAIYNFHPNVTNTTYFDAIRCQLVQDQNRIGTDAIGSVNIQADAVSTSELAAGAITAGKAIIANAAIGGAQIQNATITTANIALANITTALIANLAVDTAQINALAVTTAKIGSLAVTDAKINDLTATKITAGTITSQTIILGSGGQFKGGSAPTGAGFLLNNQGFSLYNSSAVRTVFLDATTGTASFTGTITGSSITGSTFLTSASGERLQITGAPAGRIEYVSNASGAVDIGYVYFDLENGGSSNRRGRLLMRPAQMNGPLGSTFYQPQIAFLSSRQDGSAGAQIIMSAANASLSIADNTTSNIGITTTDKIALQAATTWIYGSTELVLKNDSRVEGNLRVTNVAYGGPYGDDGFTFMDAHDNLITWEWTGSHLIVYVNGTGRTVI